nr:predicted protein [Mycena chlorophos]
MTGLVRVTVSPDSFVLLAADTAHHIGVTRPRPLLAHNFPCPGDVLAASRSAISTDYFWSPNSHLGAFDLSSRASPLLGISDVAGSLYANPAETQVTLDKLAAFDADEDVLMVIAHDASNVGALPVFPDKLDGWKKEGLKEKLVWRFLEMGDFAFAFDVVNSTTA